MVRVYLVERYLRGINVKIIVDLIVTVCCIGAANIVLSYILLN